MPRDPFAGGAYDPGGFSDPRDDSGGGGGSDDDDDDRDRDDDDDPAGGRFGSDPTGGRDDDDDEPDGPGGGVDLGGVGGIGGIGGGDDSDSGGSSPGGSSPPPSDTGGSSGGGDTGGSDDRDRDDDEPDGPGGGVDLGTGFGGGADDSGSSSPDPAPSPSPGGDDDRDDDSDSSRDRTVTQPSFDPGAVDPEQGVEAGGAADRVVDAATGLEQDVLDTVPDLTPEDVRVERDGDTLSAELTATGEDVIQTDPTARFSSITRDRPDPTSADDDPSDPGGTTEFGTPNESITRDRGSATEPLEDGAMSGDSGAEPQGSDGQDGQSLGMSGGDARLFNEERRLRRDQQPEQFGDIEVDSPVSDNRLEEDLETGAEEFRDLAASVGATTSTVGAPVAATGQLPRPGRADDADLEGLDSQVFESAGDAFNPFEIASGGKEIVEFAATQPQRVAEGPEERAAFRDDVEERVGEIADATAERAQENPAEFAVGSALGLGFGAAGGGAAASASRRLSGGRLNLGSDVSGRVLTRAGQGTADAVSRARAAASRGASRAGDAPPRVDVSVDPDAPPVLFESDPISSLSLPDAPDTPDTSGVSDALDRASFRADAADTPTNRRVTAFDAATDAADTARDAAGRIANADPEDFLPDTSGVSDAVGRANFRAEGADAPTTQRLSAVDAATDAADRLPDTPDIDLGVSGLFGRASFRADAADAPTNRRLTAFDAADSARDLFPGTPDTSGGLSGVFGRANLRADAADAPTNRRVTAFDAAAGVADRLPGAGSLDVGVSGAVGRANLRAELADAPTNRRVTAADAVADVRDRIPDGNLRDLTVRIGDRDDDRTREVRVPETDDDDLGPFPEEELGDLGAFPGDSDADGGLFGTDRPDVDTDTGDGTRTLLRREERRDGAGRRETGRRDRDSTDGLFGGAAFGAGVDDGSPSVDSPAPLFDTTDLGTGVGDDTDLGTGTGIGTGDDTDLGQPTDLGTGFGTGVGTGDDTDLGEPTRTDQPTRFGTRQDTRFDTRIDTRTDTRTDTDRRSDLRQDFEFGDEEEQDDAPPLFGTVSESDTFGSGLQSGAEAAADLFGGGDRDDDPFSL